MGDAELILKPLFPGEVGLYGLDGHLDAIMRVPEPRPDTLRRALPRKPSALTDPAEMDRIPQAVYRRVGEHTYQREPEPDTAEAILRDLAARDPAYLDRYGDVCCSLCFSFHGAHAVTCPWRRAREFLSR